MIYYVKIELNFHKFNEMVKVYFFNSPQLCPFSFSPLRHYSALYVCSVYIWIRMMSQCGGTKKSGRNCSAPRNRNVY